MHGLPFPFYVWLLPFHFPSLFSTCFNPVFCMFYSLNFTLHQTKCSAQVSQWLSPFNSFVCSQYISKKDFLDAVVKLCLKGTFFLSTQARYSSLHQPSVFFCFLPLMFCSSLLLLLGHFGAAVLAMRPATVTLSTLCQLSPTSAPPPPSTFRRNLSV